MSKQTDAIRLGAQPLLEPGEEILATVIASPRGSGTAAVGGGPVVGEIGARISGKNVGAADEAGLIVRRNAGLVLTASRLLTFELAISFTGSVKAVKGVLSAIPRERVESITSKWNVLSVKTGSGEFKLEAKPGPAKDFAAAFAGAGAAPTAQE